MLIILKLNPLLFLHCAMWNLEYSHQTLRTLTMQVKMSFFVCFFVRIIHARSDAILVSTSFSHALLLSLTEVCPRRSMKLLNMLPLAVLLVLLLVGGIESNPGPFPCHQCSAVPETLVSSLRHQRVHSQTSNFKFHCPAATCNFASQSFNFAQQHLSLFHRDSRHIDPSAKDAISCPNISGGIPCTFTATSFWLLVQHLYSHLDSNVCVKCPFKDCTFSKTFKKKNNLQSHLSTYHPGWRDEGVPKQAKKVPEPHQGTHSRPDEPQEMETEDDGQRQEVIFEDIDSVDLLNDELVVDTIARFYLQLYGHFMLPYKTIQALSENLAFISEILQARFKIVLQNELKKLGMSEESIRIVSYEVQKADLMYVSHHKNNRNASLYSDHFRLKYFHDHFEFVAPIEINLDPEDPDSDLRQQIIPITKTLNHLFEDSSICKDIDESFKKPRWVSDEMQDYTDGTLFQEEEHPPKEICLFLYMDAVNAVMNVLGSAKNKYKLLMMYFTIANLKPHHRAKIETKHLCMTMRESVFKKVKAEKSFEEILRELKELETGGILYKGERVPLAVEFILGDNLGQHVIGGFIESFSVKFFCRFCPIMRDVFKQDPSKTLGHRTVAEYNNCIRRSQVSGKAVKGIKQDCEFNALKYVHATTHLVPCAAHDIYEGVVNWDLAGIIQYFVKKKKWFSYQLLNKRIKQFKCKGSDTSNKPAFVSLKGEKLGGHAVQNWSLLRLLPYLIGDKIKDVEDKGWKMYLLLKDLSDFFASPRFSKSELSYIKDVSIPAYYELRAEVLNISTHPLKPKHHFMSHYAELMLKYGPLIMVWTLPWEQKHKFYKNVMRESKNFINPEFTCATRDQLSFCYLRSGPMFPEGISEVESTELIPVTYSGDLAALISSSFLQSGWRDCKRVSLDGLDFERGDLILLSSTEEGDVYCGVVKVIATKNESLYFVVEKYLAVHNRDFGIYELPADADGLLEILSGLDLKYPFVHPVYLFRGKMTFSLKHKLIVE